MTTYYLLIVSVCSYLVTHIYKQNSYLRTLPSVFTLQRYNKKWKKKKYPNKKKNDEENELYLQNRTTSQGEGICQQF